MVGAGESTEDDVNDVIVSQSETKRLIQKSVSKVATTPKRASKRTNGDHLTQILKVSRIFSLLRLSVLKIKHISD
jgi:hypothetical protein